MVPLVSITIVSWNRWPLLEQCLRSVARQTYAPREVIVVDQGSTDGTAAGVARQFPAARLIVHATNTLYCHAQNQAIRAGTGEFVLALNNDVVLHPAFLAQAMRAMGVGERIGMVAGKVLSWDARHVDGAGQRQARSGQPEDRGYRQRDRGQFDEAGEVFGPGGAAPLYRRALLEEVADEGHYFDERLGCFFEDLDLAWRARQRGWRCWYTPEAVAYHYRGATAQGPRPRCGWPAGYDFAALPEALQARYAANRRHVLRNTRSGWTAVSRWPWQVAYDLRVWAYLACYRPHLAAAMLRQPWPASSADADAHRPVLPK